jgi:uncharacterized protein YndB with AHSA1/START domain
MNVKTAIPVLEIRRIFDAPPQRIFDAWMIREEWQSWIGPEGMQCEVPLLEPYAGGAYRIVMHLSDGKIIPVAGVFKEIVRPEKMVFTWGWEGDAGRTSLVTITLKKSGEKTELVLRQEGLPTEDDRAGHAKGWNSTLNKLEVYLKNPSGLR